MYTKAEQELMSNVENIKVIGYDKFIKTVYGLFILRAMSADCKQKVEAIIIADLLIEFALKVGKERFNKTEKEIRLDVLNSDSFKAAENLYGE